MARYLVAVALLVTASVGDPVPLAAQQNAFVASTSAVPVSAALAPLSPWDAEQLPAELLVSEFLYAGNTRTFVFHKRKREGPVSFTVTPCTSSVEWSVSVRPDDPTDVRTIYNSRSESSTSTGGNSGPNTEKLLAQFRGKELRSLRLPSNNGSIAEGAPSGAYILRVRALERDSFVQLFASLRLATGTQMQVTGGDERTDATMPPSLSRTRLWLRRRRRRPGHRLTVRWEPSKVDPHLMRYCLVVNPYRHYSTLCEARGELLSSSAAPPLSDSNGAAPGASFLRKKPSKSKSKGKAKGKGGNGGVPPPPPPHNDIIIGCVGKRTQYTVSDLVPGRQYRFDLFAVHRRTNLSVAYGSAELHFDARARPTTLRDGRASNVSLKSLDGRATFRFKVPRPVVDGVPTDVFLYVMACGGGTVDLRAHIQPLPVASNASSSTSASVGSNTTPTTQPRAPPAIEVVRTRVEGFASLRIPTPTPGSRLTLRIAAPNAEELRRVSALQVLVTTRPERFPYPTLPAPARLHEYDSLRRCDSVTVGWLPAAVPPGWAPAPSNATSAPTEDASGGGAARLRYCVSAREARSGDLESGRRADQCALELRVRQATGSKNEAVRVCSEEVPSLVRAPQLPEEVTMKKQTGNAVRSSGAVTTQALRNLRPGRVYTVQLTVQRLPTGRPLSYDLLPVRTKPSCT